MKPIDSLAFIGVNPNSKEEIKNKKIHIAAGDSGNGMTYGTMARILLSDLILEKQNKWTQLYNPSRSITNIDHKDYKNRSAKEDSNSTDSNQKPEDNPTLIIKFQDRSKIGSLSLNEGCIIEDNPKNPIAVYEDKNEQICTFSRKSTHLGCNLTWNPLETSFDCPCHGSRFYNNG